MAKSELVQSLQRALDVLEEVGRSDEGIRLAELADRMNLKKTTAYNLLRTLNMRGYLARDDARRYQLGPMLDEIAQRRFRRLMYRQAESAMLKLQSTYDQTVVTFSELIGSEISCRMRLAPDVPGIIRQPQFQTFHPFSSASGLCLQAFNSHYREAMLSLGGFDEANQRYWPTREAFESALSATRQRGVAVVSGQPTWRLAAPVGTNHVLGICLPLTEDASEQVIQDLSVVTRKIVTEQAATVP